MTEHSTTPRWEATARQASRHACCRGDTQPKGVCDETHVRAGQTNSWPNRGPRPFPTIIPSFRSSTTCLGSIRSFSTATGSISWSRRNRRKRGSSCQDRQSCQAGTPTTGWSRTSPSQPTSSWCSASDTEPDRELTSGQNAAAAYRGARSRRAGSALANQRVKSDKLWRSAKRITVSGAGELSVALIIQHAWNLLTIHSFASKFVFEACNLLVRTIGPSRG